MVFPYCNKFSEKHEENIQLSDSNEKAQWVENSSNLFYFPAKRNKLHDFTYTGSGHFGIGIYYALKDGEPDFKLKSRIECRKERHGNGTIVINSFGRVSIINGMDEIGYTGLDDFKDTYIFFDIKFGDIKIKPEDCMLRSVGSHCVVKDNVAGLKDEHPEILCSRETPFTPNDSIALIVKKIGSVSYWYIKVLVSSQNNPDQKHLICWLDSKEGQFDFKMDQNYNVSHNDGILYNPGDKVPLKLWFKIFRAEVTMQTLGENDTNGHYNRYAKSPNNVNPDDSHTSSSTAFQHPTHPSHQTALKEIQRN